MPAWEGKIATQDFEKQGYPELVVRGGQHQIFIPNSLEDIPKSLERKPTNWR